MLFLVGFLLPLQAQAPSGKAPTSKDACPDADRWTGKYTNHSYGFSIMIPERLEGYWNSARCVNGTDGCVCMSDHGRIIPLTPEPHERDRHIEAYAGYAVDLDAPTVAFEVNKRLEYIRQRSRTHSLKIRSRSSLVLASLPAQRVVVRYYDETLKAWVVEDFIEALRNGVEYSLDLRTKEMSYEPDRRVFDSVVESFILTGE
jgi:hypothetical protein